MTGARGFRAEWPTWAMLFVAYGAWMLATGWLSGLSLPLGIALAAAAAALHSSLTHECVHGHPTRWPLVNAVLVAPALSLFVPYLRFYDTHLAHHRDDLLTDPYDDPETNFIDPVRWAKMSRLRRLLLRLNATLAGRMLIGPIFGQAVFMASDLRAIRRGNRRVALAWLLHIPALALVVWWAATWGQMPFWAYLVQAYLALALLKIRTFLEHRAHETAPGRTVVIEKRCPLAWLFLFNSFHIVHHTHPGVQWYRLPALYFAEQDRYRALNDGYVYRSYAEIFRRYFFHAKDPVAHPLWRGV